MTTSAARPPAPAAAKLVVAVDGPSGAGKSTVSRAVAGRLGLRYLDTGAMYRAVAWAVLAAQTDPDDAAAVLALASRLQVAVGTDPDDPWVAVNGTRLEDHIRSREVSAAVSAVSAVPDVRGWIVSCQRDIVGPGGIVVEGRDIGTVVVPDAPVKVFLTAAGDARAHRRANDPEYAGEDDTAPIERFALARADMASRDELDSGRAVSPLVRAPDAVELDSTHLGVDEVVEAVLALCARALDRAVDTSVTSTRRA